MPKNCLSICLKTLTKISCFEFRTRNSDKRKGEVYILNRIDSSNPADSVRFRRVVDSIPGLMPGDSTSKITIQSCLFIFCLAVKQFNVISSVIYQYFFFFPV